MELTQKTVSKKKIIGLIAYLGIIFIFEIVLRNPLFNLSLSFEKNYYDNIASESQINFFKCITNFGTQGAIVPLFFIVFFLFPLSKSYTFLNILILASYFDNLLKIIYGSPRPFWKIPEMFRECDGGYGNPSGHSFSSFSVYLSFWNISTDFDFFKKSIIGYTCKIVLLFLYIFLCIMIVISRLALSVHSLNQIIFGSLLGIALYFYFFHILQLDQYKGNELNHYITDKNNNKHHSIKFGVYFLFLLLAYWFRENNEKDYINVIEELCPHLRKYRLFNNDAFFIGLVLFFLIGAHCGLYFLFNICKVQYPTKEDALNDWYICTPKTFFYKLILFIPFNICMVMTVIMKNESNLFVFYVIGVILPYFFQGGLQFGGFILLCIRLKLSNESLYKEKIPIPIKGDVEHLDNKDAHHLEISVNTK